MAKGRLARDVCPILASLTLLEKETNLNVWSRTFTELLNLEPVERTSKTLCTNEILLFQKKKKGREENKKHEQVVRKMDQSTKDVGFFLFLLFF